MRVSLDAQNESEITPLNVASGDLDGDFRDEILLATDGAWRAYKINDQLTPEQWKTGGALQPFRFEDSDRFLDLDDMDADGKSEIIFAGTHIDDEPNGMQYLEVRVFSLDQDLVPRVIASRTNELPVSDDFDSRHFAIALGDFNADRTRLGPPVHYRRNNVLQPSVVLYTPPVHFDIFAGTAYDLSGCFPDQDCGFSSTFTQSSTNEMTVAVEVHADWGTSIESSVKAEVELKATETYGEKFSLSSKSTESTTISTGRVAAGDDWIYANILDIAYYEYPVFQGDDPTPIGYFLVSIPEDVRPLWIESKNDGLLGNQFRADHEVGNVLSYRSTDAVDLASPIVTFEEQTIGGSGSSSATLEMSKFSETGAETSWESGLEVGAKVGVSVDIYGVEIGSDVEVKGKYSVGEISTQTVSAQQSLEMRADFGRLQTQFGTSATYHVEPYAYWTVYGALAIDYKVSLPTGASSFWEIHYGGKTDLGLSLPWRYDVQKGMQLPNNDATYAQRTRDIVLSKPDPQGGYTIQVGVRVRNMGLADITTPVDVDVYLGDPGDGGLLIASTTTESAIAARASEDVFVEWVIPESMSLNDERIYVELDAPGTLTNEVHDDNNIGWVPAVSYGVSTHQESDDIVATDGFVLREAYPNPFRGRTTIAVELSEATRISLAVYDLLGRRVATVVDEVVPAGERLFGFDASGLAAGVYFYEAIARPLSSQQVTARETRKFVLVR